MFSIDGEQALFEAFAHEFGFPRHLTCFIHARQNIKEKLSASQIPNEASKKVLDDIFGHRLGIHFVEGLVDASDSDDF